jgi:integrase
MQRRRLHEGDVLTMEQIHRLIAEVPGPYKPVVWLIILAGLRPAEICGVRVRDLDRSSRTLHVSQTVLPLHSFDNERFQLVTGPPKTTADDRRDPNFRLVVRRDRLGAQGQSRWTRHADGTR